MSNTVYIQYTRFADLDSDGLEHTSDFGYRIYDNYGSVYCNHFNNLQAVKREVNEENFWEILEQYDEFSDVNEDVCNGIDFNGQFYDWEEINGLKENNK
jgi:hypothetical protein